MTQKKQGSSLTIVSGPSKFDIMVSLFQGNPVPRHTVHFEFTECSGMDVAITAVEQESGSGENWNFRGWTKDGKGHHVGGYYSSQSRTGVLAFVD